MISHRQHHQKPERLGPVGYCRDELYGSPDETERMMDEAQMEGDGGESPPYTAPGARSPSPLNLAAEYKNGQGASSLSQATLEALGRQRQSMTEVVGQASRARLARERQGESEKEEMKGAEAEVEAGDSLQRREG